METDWKQRLYRLFLKGAEQYRQHGVYATLRWSWSSLLWQVKRLNPEFNRRFLEHLNFDQHYGVDTYSNVPLDFLNLSDRQKSTGHRYEPCYPWLVRDYLGKINICYQNYEFIDLGSGKGRALLLAASYPFKRVLGVEFSEELHSVAKQNIALARIPNFNCSSLEIVCEDASKFIFPNSPLVISLFNPFGALVLQAVLDNLLTSLRKNPREVYVFYLNPVHKRVIEESGRFLKIEKTANYQIYRYLQEKKPS